MIHSKLVVLSIVILTGCSPAIGKEIPLSSIVSTSGQDGLLGASAGMSAEGYVYEFGNALGRILKATDGGASNTFLVEAPGINEAISATVGVIRGGFAADVPVPLNQPDPPRGKFWLVVYLGSRGSSPTHWIVDSVYVENKRITFNYHRHKHGAETEDIHRYYYWVPLGTLDSGVYKLELYDVDANAVTLMRRVEVLPPRQ